MRRALLALVLGAIACGCAGRNVVVEPSRVPYLNEHAWRITSVPAR